VYVSYAGVEYHEKYYSSVYNDHLSHLIQQSLESLEYDTMDVSVSSEGILYLYMIHTIISVSYWY